MNGVWQIQEAKNKLSEVVARALQQGPQLITRHGEKTVVVLAYTEFEKLRKSQGKLSEFFSCSPLAGVDLSRDKSLARGRTQIMKYLLNTCVLSELVVKQPNAKVVAFIDSLDAEQVYLSVITIGEIVKGIEKLPTSRRKLELHAWLKEDLLVRFQGKIIPIDEDVIVEWGILTARLEAAGRPMPAFDSLIAATAQANGLTLVTRNMDDFNASGVEIIDAWEQ